MAAMRWVLHPTDFSRASNPAFRRAIELAKALRGQLPLVQILSPVVTPVMGVETYIPAATYNEIERTPRASAARHLKRLAAPARQPGVRTSTRLIEGVPVAERNRSAGASMVAVSTPYGTAKP